MEYQDLISQMTLEEKAGLLSGRDIWSTKPVKRLGIPAVYLSDGPHGIRKQVGAADHLGLNASLPATCFPTACTIANSWDPKLGEQLGAALGLEAKAQNVNILLGPGLNMKRSPLCGRNFEYFSEDPYLAGKIAAGYIRGIESQGVAACPKHFAANNQELRRMASDSVLDERTFREIYLTGFEIAVKEGHPQMIMSSYNQINGIYANENAALLTDILRKEWDFEGAVVTDWGGSNDHVAGVIAGSHLEMPGTAGDSDRQLLEAVSGSRISTAMIDQRVNELLHVIFNVAEDDAAKVTSFNQEEHHHLALKVCEESIVLLKNNENILPLKKSQSIAIIGDFAQQPRYQGAGSSVVNPTKIDTALNIIGNFDLRVVGYASGYRRNSGEDLVLKEEALRLADQAEIVLYYFGLDEILETEGMDRQSMRIPDNQAELLKALATVNPNIIGIFHGGSVIEMPWLGSLKALVHGSLGGQAGALAILNVLTGVVNPSGKLAETYPLRYQDTPAYAYWPGEQRSSEYRDGLYIGYRYYETAHVPVCFSFGYGLSYTSYVYSDLKISGNEVTLKVKNTGAVAGSEIVQLYISKVSGEVFSPAKELKGFAKIFLNPQEEREVRMILDDKAFRYFNTFSQTWEIEKGDYIVMIGASVADIRLEGRIFQPGTGAVSPYCENKMPHYYNGDVQTISDQEFEQLLGCSIPDGHWHADGRLDLNDAICQMYYAKSRLARFVYKILKWLKCRSEKKGEPDLNILFIYNMPFRGIAKMMNGNVSMKMVDKILMIVNGHFFKGFGGLCAAFFENLKAKKRYAKSIRKGANE